MVLKISQSLIYKNSPVIVQTPTNLNKREFRKSRKQTLYSLRYTILNYLQSDNEIKKNLDYLHFYYQKTNNKFVISHLINWSYWKGSEKQLCDVIFLIKFLNRTENISLFSLS